MKERLKEKGFDLDKITMDGIIEMLDYITEDIAIEHTNLLLINSDTPASIVQSLQSHEFKIGVYDPKDYAFKYDKWSDFKDNMNSNVNNKISNLLQRTLTETEFTPKLYVMGEDNLTETEFTPKLYVMGEDNLKWKKNMM